MCDQILAMRRLQSIIHCVIPDINILMTFLKVEPSTFTNKLLSCFAKNTILKLSYLQVVLESYVLLFEVDMYIHPNRLSAERGSAIALQINFSCMS